MVICYNGFLKIKIIKKYLEEAMLDLSLEKRLLKWAGFDLKKCNDDLSGLKFEFMDSEAKFLIAGTIEELIFGTRNYRSMIEISILMHQEESLRCLRIFPGGWALEGGPQCYLVSHSTRGDEEIPGVFKIIQDDSDF